MMDELLAQFIVEARELVQAAIDDLLALESQPDNAARLDSAFRAVHTLKGSTGLFDLTALQSTLHKAEDNLGQVRAGTSALDGPQIDAIVAVLEWVDQCVDDLESGGAVSATQLERAASLGAGLGVSDDAMVDGAPLAPAAPISWAMALAARSAVRASVALRYRPHPECFFNGDDPMALVARIPAITHLSLAPGAPWPAAALFDPFRANLVFEVLSTASVDDVAAIFRLVPDQVEIVPLGNETAAQPSPPALPETLGEGARELRIDPARIDALLDLVGELMISKNGLGSLASQAGALAGGSDIARHIAAAQKDLDRLSASIYASVLQTRMVPLARAFRRLPRLVRDLSRRLGRPTELVITGDAIEADKAIVDELFEPLLHLVRNAMDHGIESTADRFAAGKPATATLSLQAATEGNGLVVTLADDGRGIDPERIRAAAVAKGLISPARAGELDEPGVYELLFSAGFSTAAAVSDLSGRGVGLDAVRTNIQRLGGTVTLTSRVGQGASTSLRLPIAFAMTQLLVVSLGAERFGVPMRDVVETVRVSPDAVTPIREHSAFVLRDSVVPLLWLAELLALPVPDWWGDTTVLVLDVDGQRVGVVVDAVAERMETITRPLVGLLSGMRGLAGSTVLGDGKVLLVLDMMELLQ